MAKHKAQKQIHAGKEILKQVMQENLAPIAAHFIDQLVKGFKSSSDANASKVTSQVDPKSGRAYEQALTTAMAVISNDAINQARKEVPKAAKVKLSDVTEGVQLGEFDKLPKALQKKIKAKSNLLVGTQINDLVKQLSFQYQSSEGTTNDPELLKKDLDSEAEKWITGTSVDAGAGIISGQTVNEARNAFFYDTEVQDQLDALMFMNDDPVTPICQDLSNNGAGRVFAKDDPEALRYQPPLHWGCDSYILPVLKGNLDGRDITDLKPSKASLDKFVQFSDCRCGGHLVKHFAESADTWVKLLVKSI